MQKTLGLVTALIIGQIAFAQWKAGTDPHPDVDTQYAISSIENDVVLTYFCTQGVQSFGIGFRLHEMASETILINETPIKFQYREGFGNQSGYTQDQNSIGLIFDLITERESVRIFSTGHLYWLDTRESRKSIVEAFTRCHEDLKALTSS